MDYINYIKFNIKLKYNKNIFNSIYVIKELKKSK